jgi:hypothetical protein
LNPGPSEWLYKGAKFGGDIGDTGDDINENGDDDLQGNKHTYEGDTNMDAAKGKSCRKRESFILKQKHLMRTTVCNSMEI